MIYQKSSQFLIPVHINVHLSNLCILYEFNFCVSNILAFGVVVNTLCSDFVDFEVDNKTFNNNNTLYKPNNTGGVVHCLRCNRDFEHEVLWFNSSGPPGQISSCDNHSMPVPCTKTVGSPRDIDRDLVFSTFVTGTYKCGGFSKQETISIIAVG